MRPLTRASRDIAEIAAFVDAQLPPMFGMPATL
jgi:hypothetical protein